MKKLEVPPSIIQGERQNMVEIVEHETRNNANERDTWTNHLEFILSLVGYCIGIGNIWRFPYLCYKNGGGVFLLCYLVAVLSTGIPMFLLEIGIGQYHSAGAISIWKISPIFKGLGYGCVVMSLWYNTYGTVVLSWALLYFYHSFNYELPWGSCGNWWNTVHCVSSYDRSNLTCEVEGNFTYCLIGANLTKVLSLNLSDPVVEFWNNRVLQVSSGIDVPGDWCWELVLTLGISWICIYFCIWKGIKWSGKVVYVSSLLPYLLLVILFFRAVTLPGAVEGVKYYLKPDFGKFLHINVWIDAFSQVLYSYGVIFASLIALGSYNKFHNNCYRDTMMICSLNSMTSFFAGFVIFSVIGFMANEQHKPISEVAASGPGLAFLAYPTAVLHMRWAPLWSAIFFLMLFTVGIDTLFCNLEGIMTSLRDQWPSRFMKNKELSTLFVSLICFTIGLSCVTQGGIYVFELFNSYAVSGITLLVLLITECIAIGWVYGADKFWNDIRIMIGYSPLKLFKYCWKYVTPIVATIVLVMSVLQWTPLKYIEYEYPMWSHWVGLLMTMSSLVCIPLHAMWLWFSTRHDGSPREKIRILSKPHLNDRIEITRR